MLPCDARAGSVWRVATVVRVRTGDRAVVTFPAFSVIDRVGRLDTDCCARGDDRLDCDWYILPRASGRLGCDWFALPRASGRLACDWYALPRASGRLACVGVGLTRALGERFGWDGYAYMFGERSAMEEGAFLLDRLGSEEVLRCPLARLSKVLSDPVVVRRPCWEKRSTFQISLAALKTSLGYHTLHTGFTLSHLVGQGYKCWDRETPKETGKQ